MSIDMTIVTTTAQIVDANGVNAFGTVTVTPSQAFTYYDGVSTIQVTNASVQVSVTNGQLDSSLVLAPTTGATQVPEPYYIVDLVANGTEQRFLWTIPAPAATIEFNDVQRIASGNSSDDAVTQLLQATNPFKQYLTRSDTVDAATIGAASDGRGYSPRLDKTTGQLPKDMYSGGTGGITASDVPIVDSGGYYTATEVEGALQEAALYFPTGTRMIFQQDTAPTGWTKETGAAYGDAMAVVSVGSFTVGVSDTGGSSDAKTHNHTITHTHSYSNIAHTHVSIGSGWDASKKAGTGAFILVPSDGYSESGAIATDSSPSNTGAASAANSGTFTPKYYLQIIAAKD